jgi:hypothetical protein
MRNVAASRYPTVMFNRDEEEAHHGEEAFYVVEGGTVEFPGQPPKKREAGEGGINAREAPHVGYKVVGDKALKIVSVYIVDKSKPLTTPVDDSVK